MKNYITKEMVTRGLKRGLIVPEACDGGLVARIGDHWFGVGGYEFDGIAPQNIPFNVLVDEIKAALDDHKIMFNYEYLYYYRYLLDNMKRSRPTYRTDILIANNGWLSDRTRKKKMLLYVLSKEDALRLFDKGEIIFFIYPDKTAYNQNRRKQCCDRQSLINYYDVSRGVCGTPIGKG